MGIFIKKVRRKLEYMHNCRNAYDFPSQNGGWEKQGIPVFGDDTTGSVFDPCVIQTAQGFRMFVSERKNGTILCTDSVDGIHWGKWRTALENGSVGSWEERVNRATVCKTGGKWLMWYTGQSKEYSAIGIAESLDGIRFRRLSSAPVLLPEAMCEKGSVMNPCVLWDTDESLFKMWYAAGEQYEPDVLCYAKSPDGVHWEKYADNPVLEKSGEKYDCCKVGGCDVIKEGGKYHMFYIGYQNVDTARICVAESENGITGWTRCAENPILSPEKGAWDADAVYKPSVLNDRDEKKLLLWYNGRKRECERIGLAEKTLLF